MSEGKGCAVLVWLGVLALVALILFAPIRITHARDLGQWENSDPTIRKWYQGLMRPDMPTSPCCGEADAYWADEIHVRNGKTYATITDDRDDGPLGRPHIPIGTEVQVPDTKLKWDRGNPVPHNILFMSAGAFVYCFVQTGGT